MIAKLKGIVDEIWESQMILEVSGVGYLVNVAPNMCNGLVIGQKLCLFVEHVITENTQKLYGYNNREELEVARLLTKVKGVSYRIASNLVGFLGVDNIISAINSKRPDMLKIVGVGKKIAERIVGELSGESLDNFGFCLGHVRSAPYDEEAVTALENLGYAKDDIIAALNRINAENVDTAVPTDGESLQAIIKRALQLLSY